jgi:hypothetical protein
MALGLALVRDAVRRIGPQAVGQGPSREAGDIGGVGAVAAQEPVLAEYVEVAPLDVGLRRKLGDVVRIGEPGATGVEPVLAGEVVEDRARRGRGAPPPR